MVESDQAMVAAFFAEHPFGLQVYRRVVELVDPLGPVTVRVSRSQLAFRRRIGFAFVWLPGMYLARPRAEVVLSIVLGHQDPDPRWKEVVQAGRKWWMHHLEIGSLDQLDDDVARWLAEAYDVTR